MLYCSKLKVCSISQIVGEFFGCLQKFSGIGFVVHKRCHLSSRNSQDFGAGSQCIAQMCSFRLKYTYTHPVGNDNQGSVATTVPPLQILDRLKSRRSIYFVCERFQRHAACRKACLRNKAACTLHLSLRPATPVQLAVQNLSLAMLH